jgi:hypothetical protein
MNTATLRGQWLSHYALQVSSQDCGATSVTTVDAMLSGLSGGSQRVRRAIFEATATEDDLIRLQVYGAFEGGSRTVMLNVRG